MFSEKKILMKKSNEMNALPSYYTLVSAELPSYEDVVAANASKSKLICI